MSKPERRLVPYACALVALVPLAVSAVQGKSPGEASPPTLEKLLPALENSDAETRQAAAAALSERAASGDPRAIAALIPKLHAPDSKVRYHAEWGLARAGAPAVPGLLDAFRAHPDDEGRARIARVLGRIGLAAVAAIPEMRAALADPDSSSCGSAAYALGQMRAREALSDLVATYAASRTASNQRQILQAIRKIGSDQAHRQAHEQLISALTIQLAMADALERAAAVDAIVGLYRGAQGGGDDFPTRVALRALVPGLISALDDPDSERVQAVLRALTLAGRAARDATPQLAQRLRSETNPQTLFAVKKALAALGTPEAERLLAERAAEEALEARIRTSYSIHDHQGRTELLIFRIAGTAQQGLRLSLRILYSGRVPRAPERVVIHLESTSPQSRFEESRALTWIADGSALSMGTLDRSWARGQNGGVIEQLSGTLGVDEFRRVAAAQALRLQIGAVSLDLAESDRRAIRYFARKVPLAMQPADHR